MDFLKAMFTKGFVCLVFIALLWLAVDAVRELAHAIGWPIVTLVLGGVSCVLLYSASSKTNHVAVAAERKKQREDKLTFERQRKASQGAQARFDAVSRKYRK